VNKTLTEQNMKLIKGLKSGSRKKPTTTTGTEATQPVEKTPQSHSGGKPITIEAKIDVGFGNTLYLRGDGTGLSWNQGVPLTCVNGSTWKWSGKISNQVKFKLLLNDAVWAAGEDIVAAPGQKLEVSPTFS
jgi:hypothetical protein